MPFANQVNPNVSPEPYVSDFGGLSGQIVKELGPLTAVIKQLM
jgi:hypothetical protein